LFLHGKLNFEQEKYISAEKYFSAYTKLKNMDSWGWNMLSQSAQKNNNYQLALDAGLTAVETSDGDDAHQLNLAYTIYEIALEKGKKTVMPTLKKWYQKHSQNIIVQQVWNIFFSSSETYRSDSQYVKKIFDEFADSFDEVLRDLEYIVPTKISQILQADKSDFIDKKIAVLDLGCGTGLCVQSLKKILKNAVFYGVDISPKMSEKAATKNIYKKLINEDVEAYLFKHKNKYEMIIAADVFTYFGDLKKVFEGVYKSLKKDGVIVFSISELSKSDSMWKQHLSGRFLHSKKYIENLLVETGFSPAKFVPCVLRKEGKKNVNGWIILGKKEQ
jgi:predicted TPR repeat methyltransferase